MAKLAVLIGEFTSSCGPPGEVDLITPERYLLSLETWASSLPQSLQCFPKSWSAPRQPHSSIVDEFASVKWLFINCCPIPY